MFQGSKVRKDVGILERTAWGSRAFGAPVSSKVGFEDSLVDEAMPVPFGFVTANNTVHPQQHDSPVMVW